VYGCEETLPPRDDPQGVLQVSFEGAGGTVIMDSLSVLSTFLGGYFVRVTNLHDEVLQAEEEISIDVGFVVEGSSSAGDTIHGDRASIIDPTMIEMGDLLTIEPSETANFFLAVDHVQERLWEARGLTFHRVPATPSDETWFESQPITLLGEGWAHFFRGVAPVALSEMPLDITYRIYVKNPIQVIVDTIHAGYSQGGVVLTWETPFEINNYGFRVEKGRNGIDFPVVDEELIRGQGTTDKRSSYTWNDTENLDPGLWVYRLQTWYDYAFTQLQLDPSDTASVVIP
jgi:hypothetical protein